METPPAAPGVGAETLLAAAAAIVEEKAKRARKRSRYLSDYETPTLLNGLHHDDCIVTPAPAPRKGEEGAALLLQLQEANVATADLLAALHRSAASPYEPPVGVDAGALLGFFALHRASVSVPATGCGKDTALISTNHHCSKDAAAGLNPCRAMSVAGGSAGKEQADAIAIGHAAYAEAHHIGVGPANAAAPGGAGPSKRRKKKVTFALGAPSAAGTGCSAQPPTHGVGTSPALKKAKKKAMTFALGAPSAAAGASHSAQPGATHIGSGITSSTPKKEAKNKKAVNGSRQGQHFGKPVALILQFAQGTADQPLPSKEELHSTFRGFGPLVEPNTEITKKQARVVFQSSAAAEAAYSCARTLGAFAAARLQYLRPPPPATKIPLTDVRKNLEKMIASLTGPSLLGKDSAWSLAGEMQHLLFKVNRALNAGAGPSTSAAAHHH